ncbi:hypothetical protein C8F01DRAFT_270091 [Mycena amicta]|nr:hypothetical protein C8F01DRAFT_270091 [Mycena amicta]
MPKLITALKKACSWTTLRRLSVLFLVLTMHISKSFFGGLMILLAVLSPTDAALHHTATPLPTASVACPIPNHSTTKICFSLVSGTYMTLGIALPPAHSELRDEMMIYSSFPLPYGYVGAVPGVFQEDAYSRRSSSAPPLYGLTWWIDGKNRREETTKTPTANLIVQSSIRKPDANGADAFLPLALATIKTSPVVSGNTTHAVHIFRCQRCPNLTDYFADARGPVVNMSMIYSRSAPQVVSGRGMGGLAVLPLTDSETETYQVVVKEARFENYEEMLKAARLM